ncbi:MAG: FAD-dependent oxidoreductase [Alphaproteobacteria bacterium]|nr:FAD-dependent oxidoreductase [Alphaproteobacteria bacterium]
MAGYEALLRPFRLKGMTLRNRVMSTSHAPRFTEHAGMPGERYQLYHEEKARGGIALTCFGGSSSVAEDSPLPFGQIDCSDDRIIPFFQSFAKRVHGHGSRLICQITHIGRRANTDQHHWLPLISPSRVRETLHRGFPKEAEDWDIRRTIQRYAAAAQRCKDGGLDGVEVIAAAQHLMDSFLSPMVNQRTDRYGGSLENRMRFGLEVFEAMRKAVGDGYVIGMRLSGDEMVDGGSTAEDCLTIAQTYAKSGLIDYLNVYQGQAANFAGLAVLMPNMSFPSAPFLYLARAVKARVGIPVFHASAIRDLATAARAIEGGHVDMVAMTRAHIADPHIVRKLMEGHPDDIRQCVGAGYCVDGIQEGGTACIQNAATGREATMPHIIPRAANRRTVVVAGGGPAGLEAARVAAARGHRVVLFEATPRLGGQINLAAKATWRQNLSGIPRWLEGQVRRHGASVKLNTPATVEAIEAEEPDVVIVATGGVPWRGLAEGADMVATTWDVLEERVAVAGAALIYDELGGHHAPSTAEFMAARGAAVEFATPDRAPALEMGGTNFPIHFRELAKQGVVFTPDARLVAVRRDGARLAARLVNEYTRKAEERIVDQVVVEYGTLPVDALYFALKHRSINRGEADLPALLAGRPQKLKRNPDGRYQLFRVGDAVAGRNIHAAIYDSLRLCKDL